MERRNFLGAGLLTLGTVALPSFLRGSTNVVETVVKSIDADKKIGKAEFYSSESGIIGKDDYFVLGVLFAGAKPKVYEDAILKLREKHSFFNELSYRSNNKHKADFAKECIDLFVSSEMKFGARVVKKQEYAEIMRGNFSNNKKRKSKITLYQDLFVELGIEKKRGVFSKSQILAKSQSAFGENRNLQSMMDTELALKYNAVDAHKSNLLQLTDLLTGCIYGSCSNNISNANKVRLVKYLKSQSKQFSDIGSEEKKNIILL